jgi:hypothetical protein
VQRRGRLRAALDAGPRPPAGRRTHRRRLSA